MDRFRNTRQPDWDWWGRLWPTPGATLRSLGLGREDDLAEIGSGNGYFALPAARITDPGTVYAVDVDESLLGELGSLAEQQGIDNLVTVRGDVRDLSTHLPETVDVVLLANTFHGIAEPAGVVREVHRSLRPGGRLVVVNWRDTPRETTSVGGQARGPPTDLRTSPAETETAVTEAADFALSERIDLPPYHYGLVFER